MGDQDGVVFVQPGDKKAMEAQGMPMVVQQQPLMQVSSSAVPPDLQYLASLDKVDIHQVLHLTEVLLGCEVNNQYRICNPQEQQFLTAQEDTDFCTRQCCGTMRPFTINLNDMNGRATMQLTRELRCQGCCWPCCLQEMDIHYPPGNKIGTIKEVWSFMTPRYEIVGPTGEQLYRIEGECCYCKCCTDIPFQLFRPDGQEAGRIVKHWSGCREVWGGANDFSVEYAPGELPINKALLLGATFLVDFMYFERNKNQ